MKKRFIWLTLDLSDKSTLLAPMLVESLGHFILVICGINDFLVESVVYFELHVSFVRAEP